MSVMTLGHGGLARSRDEADAEGGLEIRVAGRFEEVLAAWGLLYRVYCHAGFIDPNPLELHTSAEAVGPHSAVIGAWRGGQIAGTIAAICDNAMGLPLDSVYPRELAELRRGDARLMEIGLFGDRCGNDDGSFAMVLDLMRYTAYFGLHMGATDVLCGIPPRRAKLYARALGFEPIGAMRSYETVNDNPVVLMRARVSRLIADQTKYRALDYFAQNPLGPDVFANRFTFDEAIVGGSFLGDYLSLKRQQAEAMRQAMQRGDDQARVRLAC